MIIVYQQNFHFMTVNQLQPVPKQFRVKKRIIVKFNPSEREERENRENQICIQTLTTTVGTTPTTIILTQSF